MFECQSAVITCEIAEVCPSFDEGALQDLRRNADLLV